MLRMAREKKRQHVVPRGSLLPRNTPVRARVPRGTLPQDGGDGGGDHGALVFAAVLMPSDTPQWHDARLGPVRCVPHDRPMTRMMLVYTYVQCLWSFLGRNLSADDAGLGVTIDHVVAVVVAVEIEMGHIHVNRQARRRC
ncbi:hypothetical protein JDV02_005633 [Purpureocillium takamizusanense]|uniref:Uncharacterized protein n=1 Tax=Purpureocillium takamizusanense TaxID=2060973 RepID=A0A9Q8QHV0_9HYPO|nr:uncharacterized protein JDV02_005633 [Purpureocillium takamizusanense]UNI19451.1 hypothetical protein JDV02_005633 [Purpureocillium takamizusanense]